MNYLVKFDIMKFAIHKRYFENGCKRERKKIMIRIAVVEDQEQDSERLTEALERFSKEKNIAFSITRMASAVEFLETYRHQFDIVFMDIRMPCMDGMQAAHELRTMDSAVILVFLTSLAQYAVESYEVEASDYILKPITYASLELKLPRLLRKCAVDEPEIMIQNGNASTRLKPNELFYVEIYDHHIQFMTRHGVLRSYGTLKEVEKMLPGGFFRINNQTIVNLRFVTRVEALDAHIAGRTFSISRGRRKEFLSALHCTGTGG